ncbi:MAG: sulfite exporter TauE/SafE family protein [Gemmatimonadota bacterium]
MSPLILLALVLVGLLVGFTSGLVGIGGGVLIVPFLYFFYNNPAWSGAHIPENLHTLVANATSLFVIVPTAIRGTRTYDKAGLVVWRAALPIAALSVIAVVAGERVAEHLPSTTVRIAFGAFLLFTGVQLILRRRAPDAGTIRMHPVAIVGTGLVVGMLSGLMGIGGGAIAAALLIHFIGLDLKQAAGTSLAIVLFAAVVGTITYGIRGWGVQPMPPGSIGYVHVLAGVPIMVGSLLTVRLGSLANQRMDAQKLKRIFALFFTLLGLYLIWSNLR